MSTFPATEVPRPDGLILSRHTSDVAEPSSDSVVHKSGVIHSGDTSQQLKPANFWTPDVAVYPLLCNHLRDNHRYNVFSFTPFSSKSAWISSFGESSPITCSIDPTTFANEIMQTVQHSNRAETTAPPPAPAAAVANLQAQAAIDALLLPPALQRCLNVIPGSTNRPADDSTTQAAILAQLLQDPQFAQQLAASLLAASAPPAAAPAPHDAAAALGTVPQGEMHGTAPAASDAQPPAPAAATTAPAPMDNFTALLLAQQQRLEDQQQQRRAEERHQATLNLLLNANKPKEPSIQHSVS